MEELIGLVVRALYVAAGEGTLYFVTDNGVIAYEAEGDCGSESWFADVTGVSAILGKRVQSVARGELPDGYDASSDRTRQLHDECYGYTITTAAGRASIVFRNSSNGYYGGSLCDAQQLDAVPDGARRITDDWSAS